MDSNTWSYTILDLLIHKVDNVHRKGNQSVFPFLSHNLVCGSNLHLVQFSNLMQNIVINLLVGISKTFIII